MISPDQVTACLVTRGDVDMEPILETLPYGEIVVWDNSQRPYDAGVYGRYLAIREATNPIIYFQDDDCIVHCHDALLAAYQPGLVVGNMLNGDPSRLARYHDTTLLGWGAIFDRELPQAAFERYERWFPIDWEFKTGLGAEIAFPMLSPTRTIIKGVTWLDQDGPVLERPNRMWKQAGFSAATDEAMKRARWVRDQG